MSDMYSIAMVMWELVVRTVTGKHQNPYGEYSDLKFDFQVLMKAVKGLRPSIPEEVPFSLCAVIIRCWHAEPRGRHSSVELLSMLEEIQADYSENPERWRAADDEPSIEAS